MSEGRYSPRNSFLSLYIVLIVPGGFRYSPTLNTDIEAHAPAKTPPLLVKATLKIRGVAPANTALETTTTQHTQLNKQTL